jgi:hypothetical protein
MLGKTLEKVPQHSKKFLCLLQPLDWHQASILTQLWAGHIGLNHHLFCIHKSEFSSCPLCRGTTVETVKHFLLDCPHYKTKRHILQQKLCCNAGSLSFLLSNTVATSALLKYVHSTGHFKSHFGLNKSETNARVNASWNDTLWALVAAIAAPVHWSSIPL